MKNLLLIAAVLFAFSVTSCKKDYTCVCTVAGTSTDLEMEDVSKKDAEDACDELSDASPDVTCKLD